jgi:glucarate dehydratase
MRIRGAEVVPLAFADPPLVNSWGVHEPLALRTLVILTLDDGTVGFGEGAGDLPVVERIRHAAAAIVGRRVDDVPGLEAAVAEALPTASWTQRASAFAPLEVAAWDARGKVEGVPVWDLLGGRVRDRVDFAGYLFFKWAGHPEVGDDAWGEALDPQSLVRLAEILHAEHGFESFKLKAGGLSPEVEIAAMKALAQRFPDAPLRIDPNGAWRTDTALRAAAQLEGVIEYLEDPVLGIADMAVVRAGTSLPLATNMIAVSWDTLEESVAAEAVDIVLADHHQWGGLAATMRLGVACTEAGLGVAMHSNSHLGLSLAAMTHAAAAMPGLGHSCDTHYPWNLSDDFLVPGSIAITDGAVVVPTAPGLGVDISRDTVDRLHAQYVRSGRTVRDDTAYARRFDPGYDPVRPKW